MIQKLLMWQILFFFLLCGEDLVNMEQLQNEKKKHNL